MSHKFELFLGCLGNGITVCNKAVEESGDYKTIAHISSTGHIKLYVSENYIPADDMEKIKKAAVSEKRKFLEYWSGLSIYKKYEILLDTLKWEDCKKLMDKEKPLESRVSEATKNFIMNEYTKQADEFLSKTGAKLAIEFDTYKPYFTDDKQSRNVYKCTLKRNGKQFTFNFGDSIDNTNKGGKPTSYDILACLQKYEVGTFEDFLSEFGYEIDSNESYKQIMNTYKAVCREYKNVYKLFSDVMEELEEIQ